MSWSTRGLGSAGAGHTGCGAIAGPDGQANKCAKTTGPPGLMQQVVYLDHARRKLHSFQVAGDGHSSRVLRLIYLNNGTCVLLQSLDGLAALADHLRTAAIR